MTNEDIPISQRNSERWGYEHWKTVEGLYRYYKRRDPDYVTGSYDFYTLYFHPSSRNVVLAPLHPDAVTSSFTIESWVKPFSAASALNTVQSVNRKYWFGITGSNGTLTLSGAFGAVTSSVPVPIGRWSHVAYAYDSSSGQGTLYIDTVPVGGGSHGALLSPSYTASLAIGAVTGSSSGNSEDYQSNAHGGTAGTAFHGLIGETRVWGVCLTQQQLSGTHNVRLTGSIVGSPISCLQLNDGPLTQAASYVAHGSGVLDCALYEREGVAGFPAGRLNAFDDRIGPVWMPNDNVRFYPTKQLVQQPISRALVLSVPSGMFGRQIKRGSVRVTDNAFSSQGIRRVLVDDGRGGLYVSGSVFHTASMADEEYVGVAWNKVGNVFYNEGLVVIKDPALLDVGASWTTDSNSPDALIQFSFRGDSRIPVKTLTARIDRGDLNASLNQTFWREEEDGSRIPRHQNGTLYVTTVGIYNSSRELVGVARLAEPLRIRPRDRLSIKLRMDF